MIRAIKQHPMQKRGMAIRTHTYAYTHMYTCTHGIWTHNDTDLASQSSLYTPHTHTHTWRRTYIHTACFSTHTSDKHGHKHANIYTHTPTDRHTYAHTHTKAHQHSAAFTRETLLQARAFRQRHVYTEQLLHTDYTQSSLVTKSSICTDQLLLRDIQRPCYMGQLLDERLF